jgi:hypothetical protein
MVVLDNHVSVYRGCPFLNHERTRTTANSAHAIAQTLTMRPSAAYNVHN